MAERYTSWQRGEGKIVVVGRGIYKEVGSDGECIDSSAIVNRTLKNSRQDNMKFFSLVPAFLCLATGAIAAPAATAADSLVVKRDAYSALQALDTEVKQRRAVIGMSFAHR